MTVQRISQQDDEDFGIDVDCYVLDDDQKTAVVSQRGMAVAIGLSERGHALHSFANSQRMVPFVGNELRAKLENPLVFQWAGGNEQPPATVHGYDVTMLVDLCKAVLAAEAEGALLPRQMAPARPNARLGSRCCGGINAPVLAFQASGSQLLT